MSVTFDGEAFDGGSRLLLSQGGGPTLEIEVTIKPGNVRVPNTQGGQTTIWLVPAQITIYALLDKEIHCSDVRGIIGGCKTLPRIGQRVDLATVRPPQPADYCAAPADILVDVDAASDLLVVEPDGDGGGPGVWEIKAEVRTAAVAAGSCAPPTARIHASTTATHTAADPTIVALRLADTVGG